MSGQLLIWMTLLSVIFTGCTSKLKSTEREKKIVTSPRVFQIEEPSDLLLGPVAGGVVGDFRLENSKVIAIVGHPKRPLGFSVTGGNLIDLARQTDFPADHLNQVTLYLQDEFPRQAKYLSVKIIDAGGPGTPAILRASGVDSKDEKIQIETDYILYPDADWITLETRFVSTSTRTYESYKPGDAIQWGRVQHMGPVEGFKLPGRRVNLPWIAGLGERTSYGVVEEEGKSIEVLSGSMWSDTVSTAQRLEPKKEIRHRRHIVVGTGDTASLVPSIYKLSRRKTGKIAGSITGPSGPIGDAKVEVFDEDLRLIAIANTNKRGRYSVETPPGQYSLMVSSPGRPGVQTSSTTREVTVTENQTFTRSFKLGRKTSLSWKINSESGPPAPVKVTIVGIEGTPHPNFGPNYLAHGASHIVLSRNGAGTIPLGLGKYRVHISRGPEYELIEKEIEITSESSIEITGTMTRVVDTTNFIAAELHQHTAPSFDSGVSLRDRTLSLAAEGIELFTSSDHNVLVDFAPVVEKSGLSAQLKSMIGTEATTHSVGHFNSFPLKMRSDKPRGGMQDPEHWTPTAIFDFVRKLAISPEQSVIQINHPRAGYIGYLDVMKFDPVTGKAADPRFSLDFDAMEVIAFGFEKETKKTLDDWFSLLRQGVRITATGNSDSHTIYGRENGWPRNMICSTTDDPAEAKVSELMDSLKNGCVTISAGPFITIQSGKTKMGGIAAAVRGEIEVTVDVKAPSWVPVDWVQLFVDGKPSSKFPVRGRKAQRYRRTHKVKCREDCFVVAMAGSKRSLAPIVSTWRERQPTPIGMTNPIFIDVDGNGKYNREVRK